MGRPYTSTKRREDIRVRVANPEHAYPACVVLGCSQPTMAKQRSGLNKNYCRRHVEHFRRHGSYSKKSYTAAQLSAYRRSALAWLQARRACAEVEEAVERVRLLYWRAGQPEEAFRLAGKAPEERSRYVWAGLREAGVDPLVVLASAIAVRLCLQADPQPERRQEFAHVQMGKLLQRMAGGSHKRWEHQRPDGSIEVTALHKYPVSRGRVLRHVGLWAEHAIKPLSLDSLRDACDETLRDGRQP